MSIYIGEGGTKSQQTNNSINNFVQLLIRTSLTMATHLVMSWVCDQKKKKKMLMKGNNFFLAML